MNIFADDAMGLRRGPREVAGHLRVMMRDAPGAKAERRRIVIPRLYRESRPVNCAAIQPRWGASLQPASSEAQLFQGFTQQDGVRFAGASSGILLLAAVDQAVQESSGGDDDGLRANGAAIAQLHSDDAATVRGSRPHMSRTALRLRVRRPIALVHNQIGNFGLLDL